MKKFFLTTALLALGVLFGLTGERTSAQYGVPRPGVSSTLPPAYSPWLNLNREGGTPAQNYFGLVRPEMDFRDATLGLQQQVNANQQGLYNTQAAAYMMMTGHITMFLNTGGYFPGGRGGARGQAGGLGGAGHGGYGGGGLGGYGGGGLGGYAGGGYGGGGYGGYGGGGLGGYGGGLGGYGGGLGGYGGGLGGYGGGGLGGYGSPYSPLSPSIPTLPRY